MDTPPPPPPSGPGGPPQWPSGPVPEQPHPSGIPAQARTYATLLHLSSFLAIWIGLSFIGPLIMWLIKKDEHPFFDHHGREAVNFNLSLLLYFVGTAAIGGILAVVTFGLGLFLLIPIGIGLLVLWLVGVIQASMNANRGQPCRYPFSIRFLS